jgi:F-type H+-transporting ATPase subunit b
MLGFKMQSTRSTFAFGLVLLGALSAGAVPALAAAPEHGAAEHGAAEHGAAEHGAAEHGAAGHAAHAAHGEHELGEVNWYFGFLGESADIDEPSVLWRKPGMPVPLGAYLLNSAILFALFYRFGKEPVLQALRQRRQGIMSGIDEAARMKREAAEQLSHYEAKLAQIDADIERIRTEMRQSAEAERTRILEETRKRCLRMESEARALIVQELKAAKEGLHAEVVNAALRGAERLLAESVTAADHERLSDEYLGSLGDALARSGGPGSRSRGLGGGE